MNVITAIPLVCVRKGRKGFFKTRQIDSQTTICDSRLLRTTSLWTLVLSLTGVNPQAKSHDLDSHCMPMVFVNEEARLETRSEWVPQITHVFKYARGGQFIKNGDHIIYKGVLVDNDNKVYSVEVDNHGLINRLAPVKDAVRVTKERPLKPEPKRTAVVVEMQPELPFTRREASRIPISASG